MPRPTNVLAVFAKSARLMEKFKQALRRDFAFGLENRALGKYADHGVQFIADACLKEVGAVLSAVKNVGLEELLLVRYNLYLLERFVLRLFVEDSLSPERGLVEGVAAMKNSLYELTLTVVNREIDGALNAFANVNFRRKNPVRRTPETFAKIVQPLSVGSPGKCSNGPDERLQRPQLCTRVDR